jgi:hypothetical protein
MKKVKFKAKGGEVMPTLEKLATDWSFEYIKRFYSKSGLRDSRKGFG